MLRPIRVGLGPSSIIVTLYTSTMQISHGAHGLIIVWFRRGLATIVVISSFLAGVVLRPDNLEVFNVIKPIILNPLSTFSTIFLQLGPIHKKENVELKTIHGFLNLASVFISLCILSTYVLFQ